jgi:hypothetical protein
MHKTREMETKREHPFGGGENLSEEEKELSWLNCSFALYF